MEIDRILDIEGLRGRFLEHSRRAYRLLPPLERPRILDIGCGRGQQTLELARLGEGEIVGIDVDPAAVSELRRRVERAGLQDRVRALRVSLLENDFESGRFDVLWEEGVLHLLDPAACLPECRRLLQPGGHLVMHETIEWFERTRELLAAAGFEIVGRHMLPEHFWWTDYGEPLEKRIRAFRRDRGAAADSPELAAHERVVASIKSDPGKMDCGIYVVRNRI